MSTLSISPTEKDARYLRWIAGFNLLKGLLLLVAAFSILKFLHKDIDAIVGNWMTALKFDLENEYIAAILDKLESVTDRQLKQWSGVTFVYAGLFLTEGTGLLLRQRWAKFFTIVMTASFIPIEVFETARHFAWFKFAIVAVNAAIVWFLVVNLRHEKKLGFLPGTSGILADGGKANETSGCASVFGKCPEGAAGE